MYIYYILCGTLWCQSGPFFPSHLNPDHGVLGEPCQNFAKICIHQVLVFFLIGTWILRNKLVQWSNQGSSIYCLSKIKSLLSVKQFEQIIHLFVLSRLDYCNSLYYGISQSFIMHLQMVHNAAARLMTGSRRFDRISPILISLNWLPVKSRIILKIVTFVFKSLQNQAPSYLTGNLYV